MVARSVDRSERGAVFGMSASAMFLGNSLGPLIGGGIAAGFGLHWVFLMTALVMAPNLVWVYYTGAGVKDRELREPSSNPDLRRPEGPHV